MKHFVLIMLALVATASSAQVSDVLVPKTVVEHSLNIAVESKLITQQTANLVMKSGVINKALDAFITSGFDVEAAVDKVADVAVEEHLYSTRAKAKEDFRKILNQCLRNGSMHKTLFDLLGLNHVTDI